MVDQQEKLSVAPTGITTGAQLLLLIGTAAAALLIGGADATESVSTPLTGNGAAAPADRASALEFIRERNARAQAKKFAAMEKNLTPMEREWGVKVLGLRLTAAGYALDFRYTVLEPEKAVPLLNRSFKFTPFVLVEKSGAKLGVPFTEKAGAIRSSVSSSSQVKKGRNYSALFANVGRHAQTGDQVTVIMGDFKVEHVTVQ